MKVYEPATAEMVSVFFSGNQPVMLRFKVENEAYSFVEIRLSPEEAQKVAAAMGNSLIEASESVASDPQ